MTLIQLIDPNNAVRIVTAGDGPALIANRDQANAVLWGQDAGADFQVFPSVSGDFSILDPLGSVAVSGDADVWAIPANAGSTPLLDIMPTGTSFAPSPIDIAAQILPLAAEIAQNIATLGVPVIPAPTIIYNL